MFYIDEKKFINIFNLFVSMLEYPKLFLNEIPAEKLNNETIEMSLSIISVFCQYYSEIKPEIEDEKVGEILDIIWLIMKYSKGLYNLYNCLNIYIKILLLLFLILIFENTYHYIYIYIYLNKIDNEEYMSIINKSLSHLISQSHDSQFEFIFNKFMNEIETISFNIKEQDDKINHIMIIINSLAILLKNVSGGKFFNLS